MNLKMTPSDVTQSVKGAVGAYLMAKAYAEVMRKEVYKIQRDILAEAPLTNGHETKHGEPKRLITEPKEVWLCSDEATLSDYDAECDKRERAAGIKPDDMPMSHCPALVAEDIQVKAGWAICSAAADMLKLEFDGKELQHRLICLGLNKYHEFIDLMVKLVVNLPDFKNPMKRKSHEASAIDLRR